MLLKYFSLVCSDVISENSIIGDPRCGGAWGIDADIIGVGYSL